MELRFLPLVHAAEVLTKNLPNSSIISSNQFKKLDLKGKLKLMLAQLQDDTCSLFSMNKCLFVEGIVNTRNYNTHYSAKKKLLQDVDLHWAIYKTSLMLRVLLLRKAGIPEPDIQSMFREHVRLRQEREVWNKLTEEGSPFNHA